MIKTPVAVIDDFRGGQDTKTPIIKMELTKSPNMRNFHCAGVPNRLMGRGGFAKVNSIVVPTDNFDISYPPGFQTYDYPLRTTAAYTEISQGVKFKTSDEATKIKLWIKKVGTPAGTDTVTLEIQTDSLGIPSGTVITNGTSNAVDISDTITTSYAWVTFTFATNPDVVLGTQYHLVLTGAFTVSSTNYIHWGADNYDVVYPDGTMSKYDSSIWTADTGYNACFEVYIAGGVKGNDGVGLYDFSSKSMLLGMFGTSLYKMDKNASGTPDGTWDGITGSSTDGIIDLMEYSSDVNARTAYVSSDDGSQDFTTYTETDPSNHLTVAAAKITALNYVAAEVAYVYKDLGADYFDELKLEFEGQIESTSDASELTGVCLSTAIGEIGAAATDLSIILNKESGGYRWCLSRGAAAGYSPGTYGDLVAGSVFYFVVTRPAGDDVVTLKVYSDAAKTTQVGSTLTLAGFGTTKWRYLYGINHFHQATSFVFNGFIQNLKVNNLNVYMESTLKTQGSYALKIFAFKTVSLNDTLTRTIGSPINLTSRTKIYFDIRASRTGANLKVGIHDSGGTTTEKTYTVVAANTTETVEWDISAVADADKNAIDSIILTQVNADADTTAYIDNMYGIISGYEYSLTSSRFLTFADWQSGRALINTDIGLYTYLGTGNITAVSAAPIGKFLTIFKNYAFIFGVRGSPNNGQYSDLSDYTTWPAANVLSFNTNDGDIVTGVRMLKGKLYVFKRYSVHRVSYLGSNPTFQVDQVLGVGTPSHYSIKEVDMGGDLGTVLVFLTTDKRLAIFDGYNVQVVNDSLTEKTNDLFATADDQPLALADINLTYADLFHAVVKQDTYEYILYCVMNSDTAINYAFALDYKVGGVYPYDNQIFASSCYAMSTKKAKILYCAGYTGYMWQMESGNTDDGSAINKYWVSGKIKPSLVSMMTRMLDIGINLKEITSASTLNLGFQYRIDWNVSWTTVENFNYDHNDELAFGKTVLFDIGTIENMLQLKIKDDSTNPAPTIYGIDLYGQVIGESVGDRGIA